MDLEKMDASINEMEDIVSKMKSVKDVYKLLEENAEQYKESFNKIENLKKDFENQVKEFNLLEKKIEKSYSEIYNVNESISKEVNSKLRDMKVEVCDLKNDMKHLLGQTVEFIKDENDELKKQLYIQYKKSNRMMDALIAISAVSVIIGVVQFFI